MPLIITTPFRQEPGLPVPNATIWVRGSSLSLSDGASVTTWTNEGTLGGVFGSGTNLTYETGEINGHPVVRSNGSGILTTSVPNISDAIGLEAGTVYVVQKQTGAAASNGTFAIGLTTNGIGALLSLGDQLYYDHGRNSPAGYRINGAQPGGWDDTWHYVELFRDGTTTGEINVDGSNVVSSTFGAAPPPSDTGAVTMSLFAYDAQRLTGDIAELIIFKTALSAPDRAAMISYLTTKYGL